MARHGHDVTDEGVELLKRARQLHHDVLEYALHVKALAQRNGIPLTSLADVVYCLGQIEEKSDEARKEASLASELVQKVGVAAWLTMATADPEMGDALEGHLARGTCSVGQGVNAPKRGTPEWTQLMDFMGVPEEARELMSVKWPALCELVDRRAAGGMPLPPGIAAQRTYNRYRLTRVQLKKGVDESQI